MVINKNTVQKIYSRNFGSENFYKRSYCNNLIYTEGIMDFQKTLNAFWLVDYMISLMSKIIKTYKAVNDGFFVVNIKNISSKRQTIFEIFREGYIEGKYNEHITVFKETINCELPEYDYKFYLILSNIEPITFTLLLPSEY